MPDEKDIRDRLSETLEVLEPGLTLVEVNHKLPNEIGAKGFIDILARDKFGNWVIIELKRSDQAARQALFEILKYMPLFRQHHGLPAHRIRCFIVSTTWHELFVPFAEFRRLCETQTEGFRIEISESGDVTRAERVTHQAQEALAQAFRVHAMYLYENHEARTNALALIRDAYTKAGAEGYLLLQVDYKGGSEAIIYPFGAYLVPTRIENELRDKLEKDAALELESVDDDEPPSREAIRVNMEDTFLGTVSEFLGDHISSTRFEICMGSPERFTTMLEGGWTVASIERIGPFASALVIPDREVIELVKGSSGDNSVQYGHLGSPSHKLDWAQVRLASANTLRGNPTWHAGFEWFLRRVETEFSDGTALLHVYNPLLLPESLYKLAVHGMPEYMPQLVLTVLSVDGTRQEGLVGKIAWDGKDLPASVPDVFSDVCQDLEGFYWAKTVGAAWQLDQELMRRHGLQYSLWWLTVGTERIDRVSTMVLTAEGAIEESPEPANPDSLTDYIDAARPYLEELFGAIDNYVVRIP